MKKLLKLLTLAMVLMISGLTLVACGNSKPKVEEPSQETVDEPFDKSINQTEADDRIMVSFDTCGGNQIAPQEIDENGIVEKVYPQRDDYVFMGWYSDKKYRQKFDFDTPVNKNLTLFAKWSNQLNEIYDFQFTGNLDKFSIAAYYGEADKIVLPDTYHNMPVVAIDANVFTDNKDLCELVIPEKITQIGSDAFKDCLKLTNLQILGKVCCDKNAFYNCRNLRSIYLAKGLGMVNKIADSTGTRCQNGIFSDAGVDGDGITLTIGTDATLASYILLPCCDTKNKYICQNIPKITKIEFTDDVNYFYSFTSDYLPYVEEIKVNKPLLGDSGHGPFESYVNLRKVIIENEITSIPSYAFRNCKKLSTIILPNTISDIGAYAFAYCENLTSIIIPSRVENIGNGAFSHCTSLTSIIIPYGVKNMGDSVFDYCGDIAIYCERPEPVWLNELYEDSNNGFSWKGKWTGNNERLLVTWNYVL